MKYIRTKNGKIYKTLKDYMQSDLPPTKIRIEDVAKGWHIIISKSKVIKQADNVKELFDEIVAVPHNGEKPMVGRIGAIWVIDSNGIPTLKPVAKLNKKGEWELL